MQQSNALGSCQLITQEIDWNNAKKSDDQIINDSKSQSQVASNDADKNIDNIINEFYDDETKKHINEVENMQDINLMQHEINVGSYLFEEPKAYKMIKYAINEERMGPFRKLVLHLINESTTSKSRLYTINNHFNKVMNGKPIDNPESIKK